ncbi:hypothetical protein AB0G86_09065 [Streptomyces scabiei]|uniref:hypothetical protein n=1 Tax=Streptomyces scabiei TaxID=1930 RepID=UPI0033EBB66A
MGGEQVQGAGDGADGGVQRRRQVVDHQRGAFGRQELALVGRAEQVMPHAAFENRSFPDDTAGVAHHAEGRRKGAHGLPVERTQTVEGGTGPAQQVFTALLGPADEVGHDGQRQCHGHLGPVDGPARDGCLDDLGRFFLHCGGQGTQCPGGQTVGDESAASCMVGAVAVEGGALPQAVGEGVESDTFAGNEGVVVEQDGFALLISRQSVDLVLGQPDHGPEFTQPGVVRMGVTDGCGRVEVGPVGGDVRAGGHRVPLSEDGHAVNRTAR